MDMFIDIQMCVYVCVYTYIGTCLYTYMKTLRKFYVEGDSATHCDPLRPNAAYINLVSFVITLENRT